MYRGLSKVISGGQTGADQAGLIAGWKMGLLTGGTAPSNWYTENGNNPLLECLGLAAVGDLRTRTIRNVRDSDGTLLITLTPDSPGSRLTRNTALELHKPFLEIDLNPLLNAFSVYYKGQASPATLRDIFEPGCMALQTWLIDNNVRTLNVAGNREKDKSLMTTKTVVTFLLQAFSGLDQADLLIRDSDL